MDETAPLSSHVAELQRRLTTCAAAAAASSAAAWFFSDELISAASKPIGQLSFFSPAEAFLVKLKLALFAGLLVSFPVILYNLWRYVSPAMTRGERRYGWILPASYTLLLLGGTLGFFIVWPVGIKFLLSFQRPDLRAIIGLSEYMGMLFYFLFAFGLIFQMPLVILLLSAAGMVTPAQLAAKRKYAALLIFVAAALLTPGPDVFSQVLLAAPMLLFYEVGILAARIAAGADKRKDA